jgi:hypothetical protein
VTSPLDTPSGVSVTAGAFFSMSWTNIALYWSVGSRVVRQRFEMAKTQGFSWWFHGWSFVFAPPSSVLTALQVGGPFGGLDLLPSIVPRDSLGPTLTGASSSDSSHGCTSPPR